MKILILGFLKIKILRYEVSDEEKDNRGVNLKLKIGIYNNKKIKQISELYK